jgi:hypothetical protein
MDGQGVLAVSSPVPAAAAAAAALIVEWCREGAKCGWGQLQQSSGVMNKHPAGGGAAELQRHAT